MLKTHRFLYILIDMKNVKKLFSKGTLRLQHLAAVLAKRKKLLQKLGTKKKI